MVAVPHGGVFLGARDLRGLDAAKIIEQHEQFWNAQVPGLRASADARNPVSGISLQLLRHCSLVANNLGVMLADMGRTNDAYRTYARARDILPQNISALLNQHLLIQGGYVATNVAQVEKDFQTLAGTNAAARSAWGLSRNFGYVRTPEAFMAMGMTWALSGNPAMAVAGAKRAVSLTGGRQVAAKQGLAYLYMTRNQNMESEALYRDILGKDSNNWAACVGLARVSVKKGDFEKASTYLIRADLLKAPKAAVEMERAALLYAQGDFERSRAILKKVITTDPEQTDAWLMLAGILIQKGSTGEELDECLKTLSPHKSDASVAMITGYAALARKDPALARREFERALVLRPGSVSMLEVLLNMDFSEGQKELAQKHVKQLLSINPEHAYGNYILAKLQMDRKEYALAEDSLRRSSAANPTALVVNDLAWVQVCRGAMAEAEQSARRAIELDPKADYAYDTLGVALTRLNRFNDAQQALETALVLNQSQTSAFLHLAELSAIKGERSKATGYLDVLEERRKDLSAGELETITKLRRRLQENL
jgi:Tfp pilus assembly protein PilF